MHYGYLSPVSLSLLCPGAIRTLQESSTLHGASLRLTSLLEERLVPLEAIAKDLANAQVHILYLGAILERERDVCTLFYIDAIRISLPLLGKPCLLLGERRSASRLDCLI